LTGFLATGFRATVVVGTDLGVGFVAEVFAAGDLVDEAAGFVVVVVVVDVVAIPSKVNEPEVETASVDPLAPGFTVLVVLAELPEPLEPLAAAELEPGRVVEELVAAFVVAPEDADAPAAPEPELPEEPEVGALPEEPVVPEPDEPEVPLD
jgi:hypothetical protein